MLRWVGVLRGVREVVGLGVEIVGVDDGWGMAELLLCVIWVGAVHCVGWFKKFTIE